MKLDITAFFQENGLSLKSLSYDLEYQDGFYHEFMESGITLGFGERCKEEVAYVHIQKNSDYSGAFLNELDVPFYINQVYKEGKNILIFGDLEVEVQLCNSKIVAIIIEDLKAIKKNRELEEVEAPIAPTSNEYLLQGFWQTTSIKTSLFEKAMISFQKNKMILSAYEESIRGNFSLSQNDDDFFLKLRSWEFKIKFKTSDEFSLIYRKTTQNFKRLNDKDYESELKKLKALKLARQKEVNAFRRFMETPKMKAKIELLYAEENKIFSDRKALRGLTIEEIQEKQETVSKVLKKEIFGHEDFDFFEPMDLN